VLDSESSSGSGALNLPSRLKRKRRRASDRPRVYTGELCTFHDDDVQYLTVLARLAALAIENASLYESLKSSYDGVMDVLWGSSLQYSDT
jgi:hypothetical protein